MGMPTTPIQPPRWFSHRRLIERHIAGLHRCSDANFTKQLHAQLLKFNLHVDLFVAPKLVHSYYLSHNLPLAMSAFRQVPNPNSHLYNTLIRSLNSNPSQALAVFYEMRKSGVLPDNFTYPFLLKACCGEKCSASIRYVQMIHTHVLILGFLDDLFVPNSLIDTYAKLGITGVGCAKKVFVEMSQRDVVSWNSMISGLVRSGEFKEARRLFDEMPERDVVSWNTMIDGHAKAGEMDEAFALFKSMPHRNVVSWSTVISGYSKKDDMEMARVLFDKMPEKNLVAWTIMVSGYAEKGLAKEASQLLDEIEQEGLDLDTGAVVSVLAGCAESGLLGVGKRVHAYVDRTKLRFVPQVCNALVDMYAKCGSLSKAMRVFDEMQERDVVTWNSVVQGLAMHGHGKRALDMFNRMKNEGFTPDVVTFVGVLCACAHIGLVDDARHYFTSMQMNYGISPQIEHYGCMVDVLGRGGLLKEAFDLINTMPFQPNEIIWGTLLSACRVHKNVGLAELVVEQLIKLDPNDAGNYTVLSNIYAEAGQWGGMAKSRLQMKVIGSKKAAGSSWIELEDKVHQFTVADRAHPQSNRIFGMLAILSDHLRQVGYPKAYI